MGCRQSREEYVEISMVYKIGYATTCKVDAEDSNLLNSIWVLNLVAPYPALHPCGGARPPRKINSYKNLW